MSLLGYLAERERIEQGATPGAWLSEPHGDAETMILGPLQGDAKTVVAHVPIVRGHGAALVAETEANADFIADARTALPTLVQMVREAHEALSAIALGTGEARDMAELAYAVVARLEIMAEPPPLARRIERRP